MSSKSLADYNDIGMIGPIDKVNLYYKIKVADKIDMGYTSWTLESKEVMI